MKKEILKWRLSKLPTADEVITLIGAKIITQEEAREVLFNTETEEDRDKKSLESEIKFLRELVEKLSNDRTRIIEVIKEIKTPYYNHPWYYPYSHWCSVTSNIVSNASSVDTANVYNTGSSLCSTENEFKNCATISGSFTEIKTF